MSRHHHHEPPPPPACCSCCSCGCGCGYSAPTPCIGGYYPEPPQVAPGSDHLLHAIAAHLLLNTAPPPPPTPQPQPQPQQQQQAQPPPAAHQANPYAPPPPQQQQPEAAAHHANPYAHAYHYQYQQQGPKLQANPQEAAPPPPLQQQQPNPTDHGHLLLHTLLRRVAALETTLPHCFPAHPQVVVPPQANPRPRHRAAVHQEAPPSPPPRRARGGRPSKRELAALTIQAHFRRFLARRSRTLRQLKELAILRSKAASLRGALSGSGRRGCGDPATVYEAAMGLLFHLDAIQGEDPMIREGKRAVSRELSRILEFVDKVLIKEHEEIAMDGALDTDEYHEGCHGASKVNRPVMSKKVSFAKKAENEADASSESSSSTEADERKGTSQKSTNGKPGLAAPMPVHMESRRVAGERR